METLQNYLRDQKIDHRVLSDFIVEIDQQTYELVHPTNGKLFDENFYLIADKTDSDNYVFKFGGQWYYISSKDTTHFKLNRLREVGKCSDEFVSSSFLGIHSGYEVLNGVGVYSHWVKRGRFLGKSILGICEKNSLAGVLKFQIECIENQIKPIIGATYTVYRKKDDYKYDVKCFVQNEKGWVNLLMINKEVNVINQKFIEEEKFCSYSEGLFVILDPKSLQFDKYRPLEFVQYYQLDTVEYLDENRDREYLQNLKKFVSSNLQPISIIDAYYVNKLDSDLKVKLNAIADVREYKSNNQYFKSFEEYYSELSQLFKDDDRLDYYFSQALVNESKVARECNFSIPQREKHLPVYKMTEEEKKKFKTNEELFWFLITEGLSKVPDDQIDLYLDRIETEVKVIKAGHFIDYFLILWDIIKWANKNGILTGIGRGSAGGSLVTYLLDITRLNPLKFGLLFERFLNEGRIGKSLPDIDADFAASRRDEVKSYMESRYGVNQVCSVGTYNTLRVKSAIKDMSRLENVDTQEVNWVTTVLEDSDDNEVISFFKNTVRNKRILNFVQDNSSVINDALGVLSQPRSQSIHPCATLILPDERDIYHWLPVKNMTGKNEEVVLVSEWEGGELEAVGFLKEDILGIQQLDKFQRILDLIRENYNKEIDIYQLGYEDEKVFEYYRKGWTQDTFHFGAKGLTGYCKQSQPDNIEDLIAAISLYRPGPIESNLHNEYVLRKHGEKETEYLWGCEEITKDTYGIIVYQEQIMQICVRLGGFTLVEADEIRKALGKMKIKYLEPFRDKFVDNVVRQGGEESVAIHIWTVMERFAQYGFNKSHAAAYTITSYICQWFKIYYPLEYWATAFEYLDPGKRESLTPQYLSEINHTGHIKVLPVDINESRFEVRSNHKTNSIYWSMISVKQVGNIAATQVIEERDKNGRYFSFEEFLDRHTFTGSKVNKSTIENLILSGAFDEIEDIKFPSQRKRLLDFYYEKKKIKSEFSIYEDWQYSLKQKSLSGIATFNYEELCDTSQLDASYIEQEDFQSNNLLEKKYYCTGGYIVDIIERTSSKKGKYCSILIESNYSFLWVSIFPDMYSKIPDDVKESLLDIKSPRILLVSGMIKMDDYKKEKVMKFWDNSELVVLK